MTNELSTPTLIFMEIKSAYRYLALPVPRVWLFFAVAGLWGFGSVRVFLTGYYGIIEGKGSIPNFLFISSLGAYAFTRVVFMRITSSYILRIHEMKHHRPSIFAMFSLRSYGVMAFMVTLGILVKTFDIFPLIPLSIFMGALGISLFVSAMHFLRAWMLGLYNKPI